MDLTTFQPVQFRAAAFTPGLRQFSAAHVVGTLLGKLSLFSGDPVVLPIPQDAPREIPRIILREPPQGLELQMALARSDLYINAKPGTPLSVETAFKEAVSILEQVLGVLQVRPGRLAAIGSYASKSDEPARLIAEHFCKVESVQGPLAGLEAFELHAHRRFPLLEGLIVNSWARWKTGQLNEAGRSSPAIILERDINTLPEEAEERAFSQEEVSGFFEHASQSLEEEIRSFSIGGTQQE